MSARVPAADAPADPFDVDPYRHTGYLIRRAQQLHVATWNRVVSTETSSVQYSVLAVLARLEHASQRDLCDEVDLDRSTIADLVSRMERRGLIERTRDPEDRRRNTVVLTTEGREEYARLVPRVNDADRTLTGSLDDATRAQLRSALRALLGG